MVQASLSRESGSVVSESRYASKAGLLIRYASAASAAPRRAAPPPSGDASRCEGASPSTGVGRLDGDALRLPAQVPEPQLARHQSIPECKKTTPGPA